MKPNLIHRLAAARAERQNQSLGWSTSGAQLEYIRGLRIRSAVAAKASELDAVRERLAAGTAPRDLDCGWIEHTPGQPRPVPVGTAVDVIYGDGRTVYGDRISACLASPWAPGPAAYRIVAWRLSA